MESQIHSTPRGHKETIHISAGMTINPFILTLQVLIELGLLLTHF